MKKKKWIKRILIMVLGCILFQMPIFGELKSENYYAESMIPVNWNGKYATVKNHRYKYEGGKIYLKIVWGTKESFTSGNDKGYDFFWLKDKNGNTIWEYENARNSMTSSGNDFWYNGEKFYYKEGGWVQIDGAAPNKPTVSFNNGGMGNIASFNTIPNLSPTYYYDYLWSKYPSGGGEVQFDPLTSASADLPDYVTGYYYIIDRNPSTNVTQYNSTKLLAEQLDVSGYQHENTKYYLHLRARSYTGLLSPQVDIAIPSNTFTVTYNGNGGLTSSGQNSISDTAYYGKNYITKGNSFYRTGYTFIGWNENQNGNGTDWTSRIGTSWNYTLKKGVTLYAQWRINSYTATFNANGGTTPNPTSIIKNYGQALGTLPSTSRTGYTFDGWYTSSSGGNKISSSTTMPSNNVTYYAHWTPIVYNITYNLNGGRDPQNPTTYTIESNNIYLKNPSRDGYTFVGWTGSNGSTPQLNVTIPKGSYGNKTYTANWSPIPPTMTTKRSHYYLDSMVTAQDVINDNAKANDILEGNITNKIVIKSFTYPDGSVVSNPKILDTSKLGEVTVEYTVTNNRGGTTTQKNIVVIVSRGSEHDSTSHDAHVYSRYISDQNLWDGTNALNTLHSKSIWKQQNNLDQLKDALQQNTPLNGYDFINDPSFKENARR